MLWTILHKTQETLLVVLRICSNWYIQYWKCNEKQMLIYKQIGTREMFTMYISWNDLFSFIL